MYRTNLGWCPPAPFSPYGWDPRAAQNFMQLQQQQHQQLMKREQDDFLKAQRAGWAENRPGRTPCRHNWWGAAAAKIMWVGSPHDIDLDAADNVSANSSPAAVDQRAGNQGAAHSMGEPYSASPAVAPAAGGGDAASRLQQRQLPPSPPQQQYQALPSQLHQQQQQQQPQGYASGGARKVYGPRAGASGVSAAPAAGRHSLPIAHDREQSRDRVSSSSSSSSSNSSSSGGDDRRSGSSSDDDDDDDDVNRRASTANGARDDERDVENSRSLSEPAMPAARSALAADRSAGQRRRSSVYAARGRVSSVFNLDDSGNSRTLTSTRGSVARLRTGQPWPPPQPANSTDELSDGDVNDQSHAELGGMESFMIPSTANARRRTSGDRQENENEASLSGTMPSGANGAYGGKRFYPSQFQLRPHAATDNGSGNGHAPAAEEAMEASVSATPSSPGASMMPHQVSRPSAFVLKPHDGESAAPAGKGRAARRESDVLLPHEYDIPVVQAADGSSTSSHRDNNDDDDDDHDGSSSASGSGSDDDDDDDAEHSTMNSKSSNAPYDTQDAPTFLLGYSALDSMDGGSHEYSITFGLFASPPAAQNNEYREAAPRRTAEPPSAPTAATAPTVGAAAPSTVAGGGADASSVATADALAGRGTGSLQREGSVNGSSVAQKRFAASTGGSGKGSATMRKLAPPSAKSLTAATPASSPGPQRDTGKRLSDARPLSPTASFSQRDFNLGYSVFRLPPNATTTTTTTTTTNTTAPATVTAPAATATVTAAKGTTSEAAPRAAPVAPVPSPSPPAMAALASPAEGQPRPPTVLPVLTSYAVVQGHNRSHKNLKNAKKNSEHALSRARSDGAKSSSNNALRDSLERPAGAGAGAAGKKKTQRQTPPPPPPQPPVRDAAKLPVLPTSTTAANAPASSSVARQSSHHKSAAKGPTSPPPSSVRGRSPVKSPSATVSSAAAAPHGVSSVVVASPPTAQPKTPSPAAHVSRGSSLLMDAGGVSLLAPQPSRSTPRTQSAVGDDSAGAPLLTAATGRKPSMVGVEWDAQDYLMDYMAPTDGGRGRSSSVEKLTAGIGPSRASFAAKGGSTRRPPAILPGMSRGSPNVSRKSSAHESSTAASAGESRLQSPAQQNTGGEKKPFGKAQPSATTVGAGAGSAKLSANASAQPHGHLPALEAAGMTTDSTNTTPSSGRASEAANALVARSPRSPIPQPIAAPSANDDMDMLDMMFF